MSASGKSLLGLWLYRSGEQEWAVKQGSPLHTPRNKKDPAVAEGIVSDRKDLELESVVTKVRNKDSDRSNIVVLLPPQENPGFNVNNRNANNVSEMISAGQAPCSPGDRVSIIFTLKNQVGNLARALQVFQELGINVLHLELSPLENATNQVSWKNMYMDTVGTKGYTYLERKKYSTFVQLKRRNSNL